MSKHAKPARRTFASYYHNHPLLWRRMALLIIIGLALYVLLPQLSTFADSAVLLKGMDASWLMLGFAAILASPLAAAGVYRLLVIKPVRYGRILLVQYASMFINRLLPAGIGGMGLFVDFLYRQKHRPAQASAVVAANGLLGGLGHLLVFLIILLTTGLVLPDITPQMGNTSMYIVLATSLVATVVIIGRRWLLARVKNFLREFLKTLRSYRSRPRSLVFGVLLAAVNTTLHFVAFSFVLHALGVSLPAGATIFILSGGIALATLSPTPGGIGGAEAGFTAILVVYGLDPAVALAAAIGYRLISYWLPLIPGIISFLMLHKKRLI